MKIKVILGSTRQNRFGDKPANWITELAKKHEDFDVELLDLRKYPLPFYEEGKSPSQFPAEYPNPKVNEWAKKIAEADGFIIVSPEYNHGYSAVLKNSLDSVYKEWNRKAVAIVSYGNVGGARAAEQLRGVFIELQMAPVRQAVHIVAPWTLTNEDNTLKPGALDAYEKTAQGMLEQLLWWTRALKNARENSTK